MFNIRYRPAQCILMLLFTSVFATAQQWTRVNDSDILTTGIRNIIPQRYVAYEIDEESLREILWNAPREEEQPVNTSSTLLTVGLADGSTDVFRIVEYSMMENGLAAAYPDIKTFRGISVSDPYKTIRADWTENGFRAIIRGRNGTMYIDPFQRDDLSHLIVYFKEDISRSEEWSCSVETEKSDDEQQPQSRFGDCMFRSYRLAVAATGEYSNYFGATSSAQSGIVLSEVTTAINRVNEVYESDLAVRLILISNNTSIFYYTPGTDPYSGSACTQLSQNQSNIDAVIGSANYDIGHVFSVGSGGCAGLGVLCLAGNKARGATGLTPPTGDPFYIDYVAHEIGHQFGGSHTFNGTAGSCNGNRSAASAYEPGSGSTIMAYAGICGAQDLQPNSDDYFHARSLLQIAAVIASTSCAGILTFNNTAPIANNVGNYTIPVSTPFVLTASATDANGDPLTYCWEQYDLEGTSTEPPTSTDTDGPLFRSFDPVSIPDRYFPRLQDLTQNISPVWEVLPSVARSMTFRMTVRDYHTNAGCTDEDDVIVTTAAGIGPFIVTSQNSTTTWSAGESKTITWDVANTTASPVSCANVEIRLSTDGGLTYPIVLDASEPNDGSATITVPNQPTTDGRIMVKGLNNIFFDINDTDITIQGPDFTISLNPATVSECNDGSVQTTVTVGSVAGFISPVTLSLLNPPPGAIVTFIPSIVTPGNTSTLTISNLGGLSGTYTPTVRGSGSTGNKDAIFTINLSTSTPANAPTLSLPANNAVNVLMTPLLDWSTVAGSPMYEYQFSTDNLFGEIILIGTTNADQFQVTSGLDGLTQYYWRVRAFNSCGNGPWSAVFSFTTSDCFALLSPNVPVAISSTGTPVITSTFTTPIEIEITDLNIISLTGTHTYMDELKFYLKSPANTEILFWNQPCAHQDNFNIHFDDEAPSANHPCPPTNGLTYKPSNPLTPFDGQQSDGTWTLKIEDLANGDGGSLNSWGLKVCGLKPCDLLVTETSGSGPGSLPEAISCAEENDTIIISPQLAGMTINIGANPLVLSKNVTISSMAPTVSITGTGLRVFEVPADVVVGLHDMVIIAGTSTAGGALINQGTLTLNNVTIEKNSTVTGAMLVRNAGGDLRLEGACYINQ